MNHMRRFDICRTFQTTFWTLCNLQFKHQRTVKRWKLGIWFCVMESCVVRKTGWVKDSYSSELGGLNRAPACLSTVSVCHCATVLTSLEDKLKCLILGFKDLLLHHQYKTAALLHMQNTLGVRMRRMNHHVYVFQTNKCWLRNGSWCSCFFFCVTPLLLSTLFWFITASQAASH